MTLEDWIRRVWIIMTNSVMTYIVWPDDSADNQLNLAIGNVHSISLLGILHEHPWLTFAVLILASGIILEFFNSRLAPIFNVGYYGIALGVALWGITRDWHEVPNEHIYLGVLVYTVPVLVVFLLNVYFYRKRLFHRTTR